MCTNSRLVLNKYSHRMVRVSCGKCEECLQEKACRRANRIRNHSCLGEVALFVTLTYLPQFLPYVLRSEIEDGMEVNIYRDSSVRLYRGKRVVSRKRVLLDTVYITDYVNVKNIPSPRKSPSDYISVAYYKDLQDFIKRVRINLSRDFPDDNITITFYSCSEYGPTTKRAHFHLLIFVKSNYEEALRASIIKSWLFADSSRTSEYIEVAKDAASYVASYVNSHSSVDSLLATDAFRPKHSYSKGFGVRLECFSLCKILEKFRQCNLRYNVLSSRQGVPCIDSLPIPQYVINRYFPKFKGYFLLTDDEIRKLLLRTTELCREVSLRDPLIAYTSDEVHEFAVQMSNVCSRFMRETGCTYEQFCIDYPSLYVGIWNLLRSNQMQDSYMSVDFFDKWYDFYENANEIVLGSVHSDLSDLDLSKFQINPNERSDVVFRHSRFVDLYHKLDKNKKVVNRAMSGCGHYV